MEFNATFLISAISFILFTLLMNKIFYKPLGKIMNERENFINDNLNDAKISNDKAEFLLKDKDEKLAKSLIEARAIVTKELDATNKQSAQITAQAKQKAKDEVDLAKQNLSYEVEGFEDELNSKISELSEFLKNKIINSTEKLWIFGTLF